MKIVIVGAGRVGFQLAKTLIKEGHEITIVEKDNHKARHAANLLDCFVINEEGNNQKTLDKADVEHADFFVSVTDSDEANIIACGLAKTLYKKPITIARVKKFDYKKREILENPIFGIDYIINPEIETALRVVRSIETGALSPINLFDTLKLQMQVIKIPQGSDFAKKPLQHLRAVSKKLFLVPLIQREEEYRIPRGSTILEENDHLYVLSASENFIDIYKTLGITAETIKKIVIIGGGTTGEHIIDMLNGKEHTGGIIRGLLKRFISTKRYQIHVVDQNYDRCKYLAQQYTDITVSHIDISQEGFIEEGNLDGYDLVITSTDSQELNLLTGILAKKTGIKKAIAVVHKIPYMNLGEQLGLDVTISLNHTVLNTIIKIIYQKKVHTIYPIEGSNFEMLETTILSNSKLAGKTIKELNLPQDTLILLVEREDEQIIPDGSTQIKEGDKIITIFKQDKRSAMEDFLQ